MQNRTALPKLVFWFLKLQNSFLCFTSENCVPTATWPDHKLDLYSHFTASSFIRMPFHIQNRGECCRV